MSTKAGSSPQRASRSESFAQRVEGLFEELTFSIQADRPSILLAPYASEFVRAEVEDQLEAALAAMDRQLIRLSVNEDNFDIPQALSRRPDRQTAVFSVSGLSRGGGREGANAYKALNIRRELLVDFRIRVVVWLTAEEARALSRHAPDFWAFRHRVVEFNRPADINQLGRVDGILPLQALRTARRAARLSPQEVDSWRNLGSLALRLGLLPQARQAYLKLLALEPRDPSGWLGLAQVHRLGKNISDAIINYRQALQLDPRIIPAHIGLIACYHLAGQIHMADEQMKILLPLMGQAGEYSQAALASVCGKPSQAVELLRHLLENQQVRWIDIRHDPDLDFIRRDPAYLQLIASARAGEPRGS